jgi:zinc protease
MARNDPDWEKMYVANRILGGFFSSRLNLNLREDKGYSYGVRSNTTASVGKSAFSMSGRVQSEVTAPALVEFLKEMEGAAGARPFTSEELEFAKGNILQGYSREFETISQLADAVTDQIVYGLPDDDLVRHPQAVAAVDLATANAAGAKFLHPEDVAIIVVGDAAKIEDSLRELDLGPIRRVDRNGNLLDGAQEYSSR